MGAGWVSGDDDTLSNYSTLTAGCMPDLLFDPPARCHLYFILFYFFSGRFKSLCVSAHQLNCQPGQQQQQH